MRHVSASILGAIGTEVNVDAFEELQGRPWPRWISEASTCPTGSRVQRLLGSRQAPVCPS